MGVDIYGTIDVKLLDGTVEGGVEPPYFRNNWWSWRPLWDYVCALAPNVIDSSAHDSGHYNCGPLLSKRQTIALAKVLKEAVESGAAEKAATASRLKNAQTPDEKCYLCQGTGTRKDMVVQGGCNACDGTGARRPDSTAYELSFGNIKSFLAFLEKAEGMTIY